MFLRSKNSKKIDSLNFKTHFILHSLNLETCCTSICSTLTVGSIDLNFQNYIFLNNITNPTRAFSSSYEQHGELRPKQNEESAINAINVGNKYRRNKKRRPIDGRRLVPVLFRTYRVINRNSTSTISTISRVIGVRLLFTQAFCTLAFWEAEFLGCYDAASMRYTLLNLLWKRHFSHKYLFNI